MATTKMGARSGGQAPLHRGLRREGNPALCRWPWVSRGDGHSAGTAYRQPASTCGAKSPQFNSVPPNHPLLGRLTPRAKLSSRCRAVAGNALTLEALQRGKGARSGPGAFPLNGFALAPEGETGALPTASGGSTLDRPWPLATHRQAASTSDDANSPRAKSPHNDSTADGRPLTFKCHCLGECERPLPVKRKWNSRYGYR